MYVGKECTGGSVGSKNTEKNLVLSQILYRVISAISAKIKEDRLQL